MGALLEARAVHEPRHETQDEADDCSDETHDHTVRPHHQADVTVGRSERFEHPDRAEPPLGEHGEAADRHERNEQHPYDQRSQGDRLGIDRIGRGDRRRRLHRRPDGARRHAMSVEECRDLCRRLQLSGGHEGELVEQALGVLHHPDDAPFRAVLMPHVADTQVERRGDAARHCDLIRPGRVVPGEQREHRLAEGSVSTLGTRN